MAPDRRLIMGKPLAWLLACSGLTYLLLRGHWGAYWTAGDQSVMLYHVQRFLEGGPLPMEGAYSDMELGHPGPILFWILIVGGLGAKVLGMSMLSGAAIAYAGACAAVFLIGCWLVKRGTGSYPAAAGYFSASWLIAVDARGFGVWPIFATTLGGFLITAGVAAGAAALRKGDKVAGGLAVLFAGLALQAAVNLAPLCVAVAATGAVRLYKDRGVGIGVLSLVAGWGGIIGRLYTDGASFPMRYVKQLVQADANLRGAAEGLPFEDYVSSAWSLAAHELGLGEVLVLTGAVALLTATTAIWHRRWGLYVGTLGTISFLWLAFAVVKEHHAVIVGPFLPLGAGVGLGVAVDRVASRLESPFGGGSGRIATARPKFTILKLGFAVGMVLGSVILLPQPTANHKMPAYAFGGWDLRNLERFEVLSRAVTSGGLTAGQRVGIIAASATTEPDLSAVPIRSHPIWYGLLAAYTVADIHVCGANVAFGGTSREPEYCSGLDVDGWLMVSNDAEYGGLQPTGSIDALESDAPESDASDSQTLWFYVLQSPDEAGFTKCSGYAAGQDTWTKIGECGDGSSRVDHRGADGQ